MKISQRLLLSGAFFIIVLALLVFNNHFYKDATIRLEGTYSSPIFLNYFWDSGSGFNDIEESNLWLGNHGFFAYTDHTVVIKTVASDSGKSSSVGLTQLFVAQANGRFFRTNMLKKEVEITSNKPFRTRMPFTQIMFGFRTFADMTRIEILIDGQRFFAVLSGPNLISMIKVKKFIPGRAFNNIVLPKTKLAKIKLVFFKPDSDSITNRLELRSTVTGTPFSLVEVRNSREEIVIKGKSLSNPSFNPVLFFIQVLVAFAAAGLLHWLLLNLSKLSKSGPGSILFRIFCLDGRWIFWGVFISILSMSFFWLLGQWPGDMNADFFVIWDQAHTLRISNHYSFVYTLLVAALAQIYDSPLILTIIQMLFSAGLIGSIFHFAYKNKASRIGLIVCYGAIITSIAIAWNTILLNTTTFFALLLALWIFTLFKLGFRKPDSTSLFSNNRIFILALLFYLLATVRLNAVIYFLFLPLTILVMRILPKKVFVKFIGFSALIFFIFHLGVATILHVRNRQDTKFMNLSYKIPVLIYFFANKNLCHFDDYEKDRAILEKVANVDWLTADFNIAENQEKYFYSLKKKWLENEREINQLFFRSVMHNIPLYLGFRTYLFVSNLGLHIPDRPYYLRGKNIGIIKAFYPLESRGLINRPVLPGLGRWQEKLLADISTNKDLAIVKLIVWNIALPMAILIFILAAYKWVPLTAKVSFLVLIQVLFLFFTTPSYPWRLYYFVYLAGFLILPLVMVEIRSQLEKRRNTSA